MSRVVYDPIFQEVHGRMSQKSNTYLCHRWGVAVMSNYPLHKDPAKISDAQRANSLKFGELSSRAKSEREDAVLGPLWRAAFERQLKKPFRGFKQYRKFDSFVAAMLGKGQTAESLNGSGI